MDENNKEDEYNEDFENLSDHNEEFSYFTFFMLIFFL